MCSAIAMLTDRGSSAGASNLANDTTCPLCVTSFDAGEDVIELAPNAARAEAQAQALAQRRKHRGKRSRVKEEALSAPKQKQRQADSLTLTAA